VDSGTRRRVWRTWVAWVTAGETLGFTAPAVAGVLAPALPGDGWRWVLLLTAGAVEGSLLGWAQCRVLRRRLTDFPSRRWIVRTALAAAGAWAIGLAPSSLAPVLEAMPAVAVAVLGVIGGMLLLLSIGLAQWTVLRPLVPGAARWIGWTALGWCAGLTVFTLVATPLWQPGQPPLLIALIGVLAGLLMAATAAAVTGWGLVRLIDGAVLHAAGGGGRGRAPPPRP
jgi:hypothetical protein